MQRIVLLPILALLLPMSVLADADVEREMKADVVLRALVDELARNSERLTLEDLERPYFIEYALLDVVGAGVAAELGAVTMAQPESRGRLLRSDVRVGSYELDNTNFGGRRGRFFFGSGSRGAAQIPIEDDYNAIRQVIWWATDRDYKDAIEAFAQKKAFMETKLIEDKPDDFSRAAPAVHFEDRLEMEIEYDQLEKLAVALSAVFREYPDIQDSGAHVSAASSHTYLVNTEGTRLRSAGRRYIVGVGAEVQAEDGMELSDEFTVHARTLSELPSLEELQQRCRAMAERLIAVRGAPLLEETYIGPVLFESESAASIFASHLAGRFAGGQRPVGSGTSPDDFANKLNRRILPRFMNVGDDPTEEEIASVFAVGHYQYDDQGVKAQPVSLVEQGRLKALLMSRNPSREFQESNGHGRGLFRPNADVGCLIVTADPAVAAAELKQELFDACEDEDLEFGIRVAALGAGGGSNPLVVYRVYPDGREELVRGAEIADIDLKAFKNILAAGDVPHVLNSAGRSGGSTVVVPALLFEELDLAKVDRDFDKPPILPTPLAR
ncbi:MAG: hypothetical protein KKB50_17820 [Planctomycetes bacterium]|nr:hypothetical protein [Planctomycetota bacterium]